MGLGTRFRLFPQSAQSYVEPEVVEVGLRPGTIGLGPQDAAMYVAHPIDKPLPYDPPERMPPFRGALHLPALPDPYGHFDRIPEGTPQFEAAHLYGSARRVLDIWERYLGHHLTWWHANLFPRLELVPGLRWGNAHSGLGFLETGLLWTRNGVPRKLCLNFDVVAHEIGHIILFSVLGTPARGRITGAFLAFHETFADHVAAISALHFRSVAARLLEQTRGNLYALNLVSRVGELSDNEQVRVLDNEVRLRDLRGLRLGQGGKWIDPAGLERRQHAAAAPLSGAIWDCLVEVFQESLVARGAIDPQLDARGWTREEVETSLSRVQDATDEALARFADAFDASLRVARDLTGFALARCAQGLNADDMDLDIIAARFCEALVQVGPPRLLPAYLDNFLERDIDPRPHLDPRIATAEGGRGASPLAPLAGRPVGGRGPAVERARAMAGVRRLAHHPGDAIDVNRLIDHPYRESAASTGV